ncbi:50S ribosomal protein L25 [Candidatus Marinimicrobia bacterium]|nr:50S ribosomal protein L25 [Candidatus Neomarinimicrobiota bacterium]MDA9735672.1 50S ribosomal protein L25 [Candidatus Neomarinimicrobiota bacterium]
MSKFEKLNVDIRKEHGTSAARRARLQNKVPAVVYHSGIEATPLSVDKISLNKALRTGQMIFEVNVEDKNQFVLVKEIQYHPVTDEIIHVDFQKVKEDEKISLEVAVRSSGEAQGVKLGGLLVQMLNSVTIKCKPAEIPEFLEIDVTDMEMNTNLFVKDITLPTDVEMLTAEDIAVVSVQEPKQEKEEEVGEDTESSEMDESSDADEKPAEDEATDESSEEAKDESGDEG